MENIIATITTVAAFGGVCVALFAISKNIKCSNKQLSTQAFISYTTKFDDLKTHDLPEWRKRDTLEFKPKEGVDELAQALNAYLHLCCQQFYLNENEMIQQAIWILWEREIDYNLKTRLVRSYWEEYGASDFERYRGFTGYVGRVQA